MNDLAVVAVALAAGVALGVLMVRGGFGGLPTSAADPLAITQRGMGSVALIPGGGWRAAVVGWDETDYQRWVENGMRGEPPIARLERLMIVGWELFHDVSLEEMPAREEGSPPLEAKVYRTKVWAHCLDSRRRRVSKIDPWDAPGLVQFLPPGEDVADEVLMAEYEALAAARRERARAGQLS